MADAQGNFRIPSLASNLTFTVVCGARGFEPTSINKVDPLGPPLVVRLRPRLSTGEPADHAVLGRVLDPRRRPVAGAVVTINGLTSGNSTQYGGLPAGTDLLAVSDAGGEFEIHCPKEFHAMGLGIDAPGLARQKYAGIPTTGTRRDFVVPFGAALAGRIVREGRPVKGINAGVASVDRGVDRFTGDFVVGTEEDGVFVFPNLPADRDYEFYGVLDSLRGIGALPARVVRVGRDGSKTDLGTIELSPGWRVAGQVRRVDGKPLPAGTRLILNRAKAWDFSIIDLMADGRFDLPSVPGESVSLRVGLEGFRLVGTPPELGLLSGDRTGLELLVQPEK